MSGRWLRTRMGLVAALACAVLGLLVALVVVVASPRTPFYMSVVRKSQLVSAMRVNLHAAVEAEKSAVLAVSDAGSLEAAEEAHKRLAAVERDRGELARFVAEGGIGREVTLLEDFSRAWETLKQVDSELLPLAVQNTNLKAQRLSFGPAAEASEKLEADLRSLVQAGGPTDQELDIARLVFRAAAAAWRIQALQAPHIAESDDQRMNEIEATMKACHGELEAALERLDQVMGASGRTAVSSARSAAAALWSVNLEIVDLSRQNTNVRSLSLSLGRKRVVTAQCEDLLSALQDAVDSTTFPATR